MSSKHTPLQVKLHNASKAMSNVDANILNTNRKDAIVAAAGQRRAIEEIQEGIDEYNKVTSNIIDPALSTIQLGGMDIIVRLHKENYIKGVEMFSNDIPMYDAWWSQVDGRMHKADRDKWVDNPLPYVFTGTIVSMSPKLAYDVAKDARELEDKGIKGFKPLAVGDIVHLNHFMFANHMFYLNKQNVDFIKNPEEYSTKNWEGYVKIHSALVQAVVLDKDYFYKEISPYNKYISTKK